jgi:hypothetical protein
VTAAVPSLALLPSFYPSVNPRHGDRIVSAALRMRQSFIDLAAGRYHAACAQRRAPLLPLESLAGDAPITPTRYP